MSANVSDDANAVGGFESDGSLDLDSMEQQEVNADLVVEELKGPWPKEVTSERKCASTRLSPSLPRVVCGGRCRRARVLELPHCPLPSS